LAWRYQFGDTYVLPAKTSVTQLTHRNDEYIKFDYSRALDRQPNALVTAEPALTEPVEPRLLGTAAHLVISQLDLARPVTEEAIEKTKDKLLTDNAISTSVVGQIDTEAILTFFHSELGQMVFAPQNTVLREWSFTFALPASQWKDSCAGRNTQYAIRDTIIMQGIIDMLIRTPQGLVIIDFKTDNVTSSQVNQRAELYRRQLDLYSRAASAILKDKLLTKWLYFLTPGCAIEVE
jgi:ATP-dependent helicase/nuclease subunit A